MRLGGLTREELTRWVVELGEKPYRARQVWAWLHVRLASTIEEMTDLSKPFRQVLLEHCPSLRPAVVTHRVAADGTEKWLLAMEDGQVIETVFIPEESRGTLCISSQAGCSLACPFCHTGTQGFARNLSTAEIVEQVMLARSALLEREGQRRVTNIVLMGMGEPLYNYDAVAKAIHILMDGQGAAFGSRKITLSTAGIAPRLSAFGLEVGVNLAISLHSARDEVRDQLVPINRKYNLATLKKAIGAYPLKPGRRITWEYVMLDGINDSDSDARAVIDYLAGIPSKINLIPFNPWPGATFVPSPPERVQAFQNALHHAGFVTVVRDRRGEEIEAACGQLTGILQGVRRREGGRQEHAESG
jgi:23S rRNA (adenine2503-C2)-methyltransferase